MALLDLFRPKWKHSDPLVRKAAVEQITDQTLLAKIAKNDRDSNVRIAAILGIADKKVLEDHLDYLLYDKKWNSQK